MNRHIKAPNLLLACQAALVGLLLAHQPATAASIVWQAPQRIAGDTDVRTQGTLVGAYAFCANPSAYPTVAINGVTFTKAFTNSTTGVVQTSGANYGYDGFNGSAAPYIGLSYNYRQILSRGAYKSGGGSIAMTLTLDPGKTYMIQMWLNDSRGNAGPQRTATFTTGTYPVDFASTKVDAMETSATNGKVGQYIIGYLTMGASETTATLNVNTGPDGSTQVNALQVREAGEKTAWMSNAKYGIMLHYQIGGVLPPAQSGAQLYSESAQVYQSPGPNKSESTWSAVINNFDLTGFANDAAASGAGWVIMSVGSTFGYYNSYNVEYESTASGGTTVQNGQFTPKVGTGSPVNGDLINAVADALREKGIPLFVYLAAEGPTYATTLVGPAGQQIKVQFDTWATKHPSAPGSNWSPAAHSSFRTKMNAMVQEWSTRWGSKVAGWWFDGVFSGTGYAANGVKPDGTTMGAVAALANLDALVAAAKSGNPSALVALNPGFNRIEALSNTQDFLAGERGQGAQNASPTPTPTPAILGDPHDKFMIYPTEQTVTYDGKKIQWHNLSFIGWSWRKARRLYVTEELISYIQATNSNGGVVTLDVDFTAAGRINPDILNQLKDVKAALKPSALPVSTPAAPVPFVNLALFKPAYMRSVSADNITDPEIRVWGYYKQRANAGNDGDPSSWAEADIQAPETNFTYSYIVDLGSSQPIDRIVYYPAGHYPPTYKLDYSADGTTWSSFNAASYSVNNNDIRMHDAGTTKNARYVRLKALTYNGGMSIGEFEVYNTSSASTAADIVWVDENIPGINTTNKTVKLVNTTGTWNWESTLASAVTQGTTGDNPFPKGGLRYHWSPVVSGTNEHGFTNSPAILKTAASGDSLYCWVYVPTSQPTTEIVLKWTATDGTVGSARWGGATPQISGAPATATGTVPATDQWVKLSVSASAIGLANKSLSGMSFAHYNGKVYFDRAGKTRP